MIHGKFGEAFVAQGLVDQAATQLQAALRIDPRNAEIVEALASVLLGAGRDGDAIDVLRKGIARVPNAPDLAGQAGE